MKLQDIKVGMRVHDTQGNKYEVESVRLDKPFFPVVLRCIEFKEPVCKSYYAAAIRRTGDCRCRINR